MKTKINNPIRISLLVLLTCWAIFPAAFAATPEGDFHLLKKKNGIDLFYRWMVMTDGSKVRQMKAVLEINGGVDDVLGLLKDESRAFDWLKSAEQFRNLTEVSGPEWASYIHFSVPWPLADQDCILEYGVDTNEAGETVVRFKCNPDYMAPVDGITRMKDIDGAFVIKPQPDGRSILECYFLSKKASAIPRWVTEPIITGSILNVLDALRSELTEV